MECVTGKRASVATLWRSLQYLGITRKKLQKAALERNEIIQGFVAVDIFEGSYDKKRFVDFVLDQVVPIMNPYPVVD
ncbi:unnamed protein product [Rhizophagus irregularis]|nr:unnamed protein product [Rhizophagus irregularis]